MEHRAHLLSNIVICICVIFTFFLFNSDKVQAKELPPGVVIGDNHGVNATSKGIYHVNVTDVLPGGKWHTTITMLNLEKDIPYHLTMLISPSVVSGKLDLSKEIQMTLTYEGKVIYFGPASGISDTQNLQVTPLDLGVFSGGDSRALEVEYSLSGKYSNEDFSEKNVMENVWTYSAIKTVKPTDSTNTTDKGSTKKVTGRLPSTGEIKQGMIFICLSLFLVLLILLMWKKMERK